MSSAARTQGPAYNEPGWLDTIAAHPDVFGTGKTGA